MSRDKTATNMDMLRTCVSLLLLVPVSSNGKKSFHSFYKKGQNVFICAQTRLCQVFEGFLFIN